MAGSRISSLPLDILVDVIARVAANSFCDLFNAQLCCKEFDRAGEDKYTLQHVSIDKLPVIHRWLGREEVNSFFNRCMDSGNPEALFRQGMVEYFNTMRVEVGLEFLRRAAEQGHAEATYVYGMILLSTGGPSSLLGLQILNTLTSSESINKKIQDCRERIRTILRAMWIKNRSICQPPRLCHNHATPTTKVTETWGGRRIEDDGSCEACKWDSEFNLFCNMLIGVGA
ncbi:hypothetical protein NMG60_11024770 [Bertholletia excelsa]